MPTNYEVIVHCLSRRVKYLRLSLEIEKRDPRGTLINTQELLNSSNGLHNTTFTTTQRSLLTDNSIGVDAPYFASSFAAIARREQRTT